jgi:trimeric autotransporter adhesin
VAGGYNADAGGQGSTAFGYLSDATASRATAIGYQAKASGDAAVALGAVTTASGNNSTALGTYASTNGKTGSFVYGDFSILSNVSALADNQFVVRAQQLWFGTNNSVTATSGRFLETSTGAYLTTGGTWTNSSSRALKTNFAPVNSRDVLHRVLRLPLQTWNYKAEDGKVRHIGAVSQDFHRLFGYGDSVESIATVDADGVALAAIQGLHEELKDRDAKLEQLQQQLKQQQAAIDGLRKLVCAQSPQAEVCQK